MATVPAIETLEKLAPALECRLYQLLYDGEYIALLKDTKLTESKVLEFRLETFNTFNHAQFFGPNSVDGHINDSTFGQVLSAMPPQLAFKFQF